MRQEVARKATSDLTSLEEPLFVLKYLKRRMIVLIMGCLFIVPMEFYALFVHAARSTFELIFVKLGALLFLLLVIPGLLDMMLVKEIRLYKDRIVKVWRLIGRRELELAEAGLRCQSFPTIGIGKKGFFKQGTNVFWGRLLATFFVTEIAYNEHFADRVEVEQLNRILGELSGRQPEEFEQTVEMERLISK
jgi:hypothetical protein